MFTCDEKTKAVLEYLLKKYPAGRIISLSEAMLESNFNPEDFGEAVTKLAKANVLILSSGGAIFTDVKTKRGTCTLYFDVTNEEMWNSWKCGLYSQGFTNQMREKIVKMYTKIPFRTMGKYKMDYARITPKIEWKYNFLGEGDRNELQ